MEQQDGRCASGRDDFNDIFEQLLGADAIVLGSPTYFSGVSTEMKALIDRAGFVAMANGCAFAGKIGASVVAVRRGGATHAFDSMNHLFFISQMIVPGSTYWNMGYGLEEGMVEQDAEAMRNMESWARPSPGWAGPWPEARRPIRCAGRAKPSLGRSNWRNRSGPILPQ